jgi:hypothetical protein
MSALTTNTEIKLALEAFKTGHQGMLAQPKVRPSPTPEGATPTATAAPPKKKNPNKHKKNQLKG